MVPDETVDGERIARLLSSEVHGHERGSLGRLSVVDAEADVEPSEAGSFAYAIGFALEGEGTTDTETDGTDTDGANTEAAGTEEAETEAADMEKADTEGTCVAEVYVHSDRARVAFRAGVETAVEAAEREELRARSKAVDPPRTLVFVESGAEVKNALRVVRAVADRLLEDGAER